MIKPSIKGLYTIADNTTVPQRTHRELALACLQGGARILQLRMKGEGDRGRVAATAREILRLKKEFEFLFIVNDFLDIARELKADGYHGGRDDPPIEEARRLLGPGRVIGYSAHSLEEALEAERRGADYVAFGAIYPSPLKGPGHPIQGIEKLKEVVSALKVPVVAIGGIGRDNIGEVLATGVGSVAMISALVRAADIADEVRRFCIRF